MATSVPPLMRIGAEVAEMQPGYTQAGSANTQPLLPLQATGLVAGVLGAEVAVLGSDFIWTADYLPYGRQVYLETYASGSLLGTQVISTLYATTGPTAGQAVAGAVTTTINTTTGALARSVSAFTLSEGVTYQLRFKPTLLGTATLKKAQLLFL